MKDKNWEEQNSTLNEAANEAVNSMAGCVPEIKILERALKFYDDVLDCKDEDERMAIGNDHHTWVLRASRKVVEAHNA